MNRIGGVPLQFASQAQDVSIHGPRMGIVMVTPNLIQKFVTRNHAACILYHELQGLKFLCCKPN
jgi:hypothetical protein